MVEDVEPRAERVEAMPRSHRVERKPRAGIPDGEPQAAVLRFAPDADLRRSAPRGGNVLDAVLDDRLERERRHLAIAEPVGHVDGAAETVAQARLLDPEAGAH